MTLLYFVIRVLSTSLLGIIEGVTCSGLDVDENDLVQISLSIIRQILNEINLQMKNCDDKILNSQCLYRKLNK